MNKCVVRFFKRFFLVVFLCSLIISCKHSYCISTTKIREPKIKVNSVLDERFFVSTLNQVPINVVAPSSGVTRDELKYFQNQELLELLVPENLLSQIVPYNSNSDVMRFEQLKNSFNNNSSIIWSVRGGYGSARLYESLAKLKQPANEKVFIGYSDATFLHLFLTQKWGWKTIHGAMLSELLKTEKDPKNFSIITDILSGKSEDLKYEGIKPFNKQAHLIDQVDGVLTGGNLELLNNSLGTQWQINGNDKIIFIEDIGTKGYALDRSLNHLKQAGIFKNAKAILLGEFINGDAFVGFALERFAEQINIPVYKANIFGHGNKNYPLIFNSNTVISSRENSITMKINYEFTYALKTQKDNFVADN
ncbi:LD-carboxypeptidase [Fluviispira multicolorata]|uniref:LD-carboxypeptidase n=1 Tax=Fluviispira multicolorata TaxID=2654512 RepID=A0A833JCM1_9BACT|nr:LD-carboxypeptidase [Fluviispira multicolorata]KAB8027403.1 LD-carboxypeptidase [Fluviispira multicolorata]